MVFKTTAIDRSANPPLSQKARIQFMLKVDISNKWSRILTRGWKHNRVNIRSNPIHRIISQSQPYHGLTFWDVWVHTCTRNQDMWSNTGNSFLPKVIMANLSLRSTCIGYIFWPYISACINSGLACLILSFSLPCCLSIPRGWITSIYQLHRIPIISESQFSARFAGEARLELATHGLTVRCSNLLNYSPIHRRTRWCLVRRTLSNTKIANKKYYEYKYVVVRYEGLEPPRLSASVPKADVATITPISQKKKNVINVLPSGSIAKLCGPGGVWTLDLQIMSLLLWPTELRAQSIEWASQQTRSVRCQKHLELVKKKDMSIMTTPVAGVGLEPHDLQLMRLTSWPTALPRSYEQEGQIQTAVSDLE